MARIFSSIRSILAGSRTRLAHFDEFPITVFAVRDEPSGIKVEREQRHDRTAGLSDTPDWVKVLVSFCENGDLHGSILSQLSPHTLQAQFRVVPLGIDFFGLARAVSMLIDSPWAILSSVLVRHRASPHSVVS